jgi:hypothetical protein
MNKPGRLAYWRAKAALCEKLFYEQVQDKKLQDEAVENLARFIHANREVDRLTNGINYDWIYSIQEGVTE